MYFQCAYCKYVLPVCACVCARARDMIFWCAPRALAGMHFIHVCACICYIWQHASACVHSNIDCKYAGLQAYVCMYVRTCARMYACMHVCMQVYMNVCARCYFMIFSPCWSISLQLWTAALTTDKFFPGQPIFNPKILIGIMKAPGSHALSVNSLTKYVWLQKVPFNPQAPGQKDSDSDSDSDSCLFNVNPSSVTFCLSSVKGCWVKTWNLES